jgi:hypothetical protein
MGRTCVISASPSLNETGVDSSIICETYRTGGIEDPQKETQALVATSKFLRESSEEEKYSNARMIRRALSAHSPAPTFQAPTSSEVSPSKSGRTAQRTRETGRRLPIMSENSVKEIFPSPSRSACEHAGRKLVDCAAGDCTYHREICGISDDQWCDPGSIASV